MIHRAISNLILTVIGIILAAILSLNVVYAAPVQTIASTIEITPVMVYVETDDRAELRRLIDDAIKRRDAAENVLTSNPTDWRLQWARQEYTMSNDAIIYYSAALQATYDNEWQEARQRIIDGDKYAAADYIWARLTDAGFSNYVSAGIMGNIMAEVGGQSLYIQYWLNNGEYSGICQWSKDYFPDASGKDLQAQVDYLLGNIEDIMNTCGDYYRWGFTYNDFIALDSAKAAAGAFCLCYEKCGTASYAIRQDNAVAALQYYS